MKMAGLVQVLALSMLGFVISGIGCAANGEGPSQEEKMSIEEKYETLKTAAIEGNSAAKLDAFTYAYQHASQLRDHLQESLEFLVQSATAGNADAQYNIGFLLQTGTWIREDEEEALSWFLLAAQQGHLTAQLWSGVNLASKYYRENDEAKRNVYYQNAVHWFERVNRAAAPLSDERFAATEGLGRIYLSQPDSRGAGIRLLNEAAAAGYAPAQETLEDYSDLIEDWNRKQRGESNPEDERP